MISVAGGVYLERCLDPKCDEIYGSAGRAAVALSYVSQEVALYTYLNAQSARLFNAIARSRKIHLKAKTTTQNIGFSYVHCLSNPAITPRGIFPEAEIHVASENILRFGMMESSIIADGKNVTYDPQSASSPQKYHRNGSKAERLAVIVNANELRIMTGLDDLSDAANQLLSDGADVVVTKMASQGCRVQSLSNGVKWIPAYMTSNVWSIGSGDIFSAAFAFYWGESGLDPEIAAILASRNTAKYCDSRSIEVLPRNQLETSSFQPQKNEKTLGRVYLAGPFFSLSERWLVEESVTYLHALGMRVYSPYHEVGHGPAEVVAKADLEGLEKCDRILALLNGNDPGTIFEIGYAVAKGLPVVVFAQNVPEEDLKMIKGTNCQIYDDFASALYNVCWVEGRAP